MFFDAVKGIKIIYYRQKLSTILYDKDCKNLDN